VALERFFEDLSNGHEFFTDQAFGLAEISKTSCPVFFFAIVIAMKQYNDQSISNFTNVNI